MVDVELDEDVVVEAAHRHVVQPGVDVSRLRLGLERRTGLVPRGPALAREVVHAELGRERLHVGSPPSSRTQLSCGYRTRVSASSCAAITSSDSCDGTHSVIIATRRPGAGTTCTGRRIRATKNQQKLGSTVVRYASGTVAAR